LDGRVVVPSSEGGLSRTRSSTSTRFLKQPSNQPISQTTLKMGRKRKNTSKQVAVADDNDAEMDYRKGSSLAINDWRDLGMDSDDECEFLFFAMIAIIVGVY
jgi:hypothetical protein